jgi:hypothetical protein
MAIRKPIVSVSGQKQEISSADKLPIANIPLSRSITVESPTNAEKIPIFFTSQAMTITKIRAVVKGSSPSVTYNIAYGTDISASGTNVTTSPSAVTNASTGVDATLNNTAVPADGWVWLITTAKSGTVDWITITIEF